MPPEDPPASVRTSQPSAWRTRVGCLGYLLAFFALAVQVFPWPLFYQAVFDLAVLSIVALVVIRRIRRRRLTTTAAIAASVIAWSTVWAGNLSSLSWYYQAVYHLAVLSIVALVVIAQIHASGLTIAEAIAAGRAERRRQIEERNRVREAVAALPWLRDKQLGPGAVPGVLVAPPPDLPGYHHVGYDVVLDSAGHRKSRVVKELRALTGLDLKEASELVDGAPATVLRVPDVAMASAARTILESADATVSITDPAS